MQMSEVREEREAGAVSGWLALPVQGWSIKFPAG
jgi:hypothetical protein